MSTATAEATATAVVTIKPVTGKKVTHRFNANAGPRSRAAKWLQDRYTVSQVISEVSAVCTTGDHISIKNETLVGLGLATPEMIPGHSNQPQQIAQEATAEVQPIETELAAPVNQELDELMHMLTDTAVDEAAQEEAVKPLPRRKLRKRSMDNLRDRCTLLELPTEGTKEELVDRIIAAIGEGQSAEPETPVEEELNSELISTGD